MQARDFQSNPEKTSVKSAKRRLKKRRGWVWGDTAAAEGKYATSLVLDLVLMYQNDARIRRESKISLLTQDQQHLCGGTLPLLATVSPDFESPLMSWGGGGN